MCLLLGLAPGYYATDFCAGNGFMPDNLVMSDMWDTTCGEFVDYYSTSPINWPINPKAWSHQTCMATPPMTSTPIWMFLDWLAPLCCASSESKCSTLNFPDFCKAPNTFDSAVAIGNQTCGYYQKYVTFSAENQIGARVRDWTHKTCTIKVDSMDGQKVGKTVGYMGIFGCCGMLDGTTTPVDSCYDHMPNKWRAKLLNIYEYYASAGSYYYSTPSSGTGNGAKTLDVKLDSSKSRAPTNDMPVTIDEELRVPDVKSLMHKYVAAMRSATKK